MGVAFTERVLVKAIVPLRSLMRLRLPAWTISGKSSHQGMEGGALAEAGLAAGVRAGSRVSTLSKIKPSAQASGIHDDRRGARRA
jgi:hypothetical protein